MKKYFAVDIGSNTMMMSVAQKKEIGEAFHSQNESNLDHIAPNVDVHVEAKISQTHWQKDSWHYTDFFRFAALAKGMDQSKMIAQERLQAGLKILREYQSIIENESTLQNEVYICATATSAIREAANKDYVIAEMEKIFKSPINVISGEKEGELTFWGSASHLDHPVAVIDIGGGSSEIILASEKKCRKIISLPIGAIRWKDRYPRNVLSQPNTQKKIISEIVDYLKNIWKEDPDLLKIMRECSLYAVAGVATTLCAVHYQCLLSDFKCLEEKSLSLSTVQNLREAICAFSPEQLLKDQRKFDVIDENRAEIMGISSIIFEAILRFLCERFGAKPRVSISVRGLRYGLLHLMQKKMTDQYGLKITQKS